MHLRRTALCFLVVGCTTAEVEPPISTLDGRSDIAPELHRDDLQALDPRLDSDNDGLVDVDELVGWEIRVDQTGRPQGVETRVVRSDPTMADTDRDGLSDGLERLSGADPNRADTDGDGLSDVHEVQRWGTSPASVDTDGDARGPNPDPSAAPNVDLFDAAELALIPDPRAPGEMTSSLDATSPLLEDTDGDGVTDYAEALVATRSATLAETPSVGIAATAGTTIGAFLEVTDTATGTMTQTFGSSESSSMAETGAFHTGNTFSIAPWTSRVVDAGVTIDGGLTGGSVNAYLNVENEVGVTVTKAARFGISGSTSTRWGSASRDARSQLEGRTITVTGGRVTFSADLINNGDVAFRLRNLRVEAAFFDDAAGRMRALTTLRPVSEPMDGIVLARGDSTSIILESRDVETGRLLDLMSDASSFVVQASNFDVLDAGDDHYAFTQARVSERTSAVTIEDGSSEPRVFRIATNVRRDVMGRETGLTIAEVLERQGIPFMAEPITDPVAPLQRFIFEIGGARTELHSGPPPALGDPAYPAGLEPGARAVRRGWYALMRRRNGDVDFTENLLAESLLPGDQVALIFTEDQDRDGICAAEEELASTSDTNIDSDGDGLSDYFELRVGWHVAVANEPRRFVHGSAREADADEDGLNDRSELLVGGLDAAGGYIGTHPRRADTDRDGQSDQVEAADASDALDPLRFDDAFADTVRCTTNERRARARGEPVMSWYSVNDTNVDLTHVVVQFPDGTETFDHNPARILSGQVLHRAGARSVYAVDTTGQRSEVAYCVEGGAL